MDIVLDSNIFRGDILLRSKDFEILLDYLDKTSSSLLFPQIILDEIAGIYARVLKDRVADLNKAVNNINLTLTDEDPSCKLKEIDIPGEVNKYKAFIKTKLKFNDRYFLPYNNDYLPEIVSRAINRLRPCGEKGQGFRDALIWLTIKDYTMKCHEKQITFISNNTEDFANSEKNSLHESLSDECNELGIRINYFKSVKEFIENHSTKIDFINYDWISENLDNDVIGEMVLDQINGRTKSSITSWFQKKTGDECTGHYKALSCNLYSEKDLFVYEMVDNTLVVNVTVVAEIEIEFEYYNAERVRQWEIDDFHYYHERSASSRVEYLDSELYVTITLENGEVVDTDLSDWDHW